MVEGAMALEEALTVKGCAALGKMAMAAAGRMAMRASRVREVATKAAVEGATEVAAGEATEEAIEEATVAAFVEGRGWVVEASEEVVEAWEDTGVDVWAHVQVVKGVGAWG